MKIYIAGNCQAGVLAELLRGATGLSVECLKRNCQLSLEKSRIIFSQSWCSDRFAGEAMLFPRIFTTGFHPDAILAQESGGANSPLRGYCSSIVRKAWCEGLSAKNTALLFNSKLYERLGFFDSFEKGKAQMFAEGREVQFPLERLFEHWISAGCFMHTVNHPKLRVMIDLAEILLARTGLSRSPIGSVRDPLENGCGWPVYPELGERLGLRGGYEFRMHYADGGSVLNLNQFIEKSFEILARETKDRSVPSARLRSVRYQNLRDTLPLSLPGANPYAGQPEHQFWRQSIHGDVDPVTISFPIGRQMRIATAGSCFAQHVARSLEAHGFDYFIAETDPGTGGANYGVFSARYGNIYTPRQLVQLFDRAHGKFKPCDIWWRRNGRIVDPFRPMIEHDDFEDVQAMQTSRRIHFAAVRRMFRQMDIFIFTLGLTEAWRAKADGAVFPLAPGVSGGTYDPGKYEFVNFTVTEVIEDLKSFLCRLAKVNKKAKVILTVSPVPLAATYEPKHVLVATTYSKSVLRVAAEDIARDNPNVVYFPSYEIITGSFNRGMYFEKDLRTVTPQGVDHVMRMFVKHFASEIEAEEDARRAIDIVCEEEELLRVHGSGPQSMSDNSRRRGAHVGPWRRIWPAIRRKIHWDVSASG